MKQGIKTFTSVIAFLLVLVLVLAGASFVLCEKPADLYLKEPGTIDVAVVGGSIAYTAISPALLWDEYGIASYVLGLPMEHVSVLYYFVAELFKTQSPRVVALETMCLRQDYVGSLYTVINQMKFSQNKLQALQALYPTNWWQYVVPLYGQHGNYNNIRADDFTYAEDPGNGYWFWDENIAGPVQPAFDVYTASGEAYTFPDISVEYVQKLAALCAANGSELVLFKTPTTTNYTPDESAAAAVLADSLGISFLEYNLLYDELGFVPEENLVDDVHTNYVGARALSHHFGGWLNQHYALADRRGDPVYAPLYEKVSARYARLYKNARLAAETDFVTFAHMLDDENYLIAATAVSWGQNGTTEAMQNAWHALGFGGNMQVEHDFTYAAVWDSGTVLYEQLVVGTQHYSAKISGMRVDVSAYMYQGNTVSNISVNGAVQQTNVPGYSIFVYDKQLDQLAAVAWFDLADPAVRMVA